MTVSSYIGAKALQAQLDSERRLRSLSEQHANQFGAVLTDIARQFGGTALEQASTDDPLCYQRWSPSQWRQFFQQLQPLPQWTNPARLEAEVAKLTRQVETLTVENQRLQTRLTQAAQQPNTVPAEQASAGRDTPQLSKKAQQIADEMVNYVMPVNPTVPRNPPGKFNSLRVFRGEHTKWHRIGYVLWLLSTQRLSVTIELRKVLSIYDPKSATNADKLLTELKSSGLVTATHKQSAIPRQGGLGMHVSLYELTPLGVQICEACGWTVIENEWQRLKRLHQGEQQLAHSAAILYFAFYARRAGYQVEIMPEVPGKAESDVLIRKGDEQHYIEVELGYKKGKGNKWKNMAALQGYAVVVSAHPGMRQKIVDDIKTHKIAGRATDLQTLNSNSGAFWTEMWTRT